MWHEEEYFSRNPKTASLRETGSSLYLGEGKVLSMSVLNGRTGDHDVCNCATVTILAKFWPKVTIFIHSGFTIFQSPLKNTSQIYLSILYFTMAVDHP